MTKSFSNFADLASFIASEIDSHDRATTYEHAFIEHDERAKLSPVDEAEQLDMPDPEQARVAVEMVMSTLFDVFRDTRLEPYAADLAWGFVNSFHVVAKRINDREDDAAKELGELARSFDPSEIYAAQLEDAQLLCQTLQGCRDAMECMRDHASEVYRVETGRPYSPTRGSRVSRVDHVERRIEQLVGRGQLIAGEARIGDTHPRMVTTREALLTEERILGAVEEGRGLASPILAAQDAPGRLQAVADRELNAGQLGAAALILSSEDRTVAIQGIAGAGKSTIAAGGCACRGSRGPRRHGPGLPEQDGRRSRGRGRDPMLSRLDLAYSLNMHMAQPKRRRSLASSRKRARSSTSGGRRDW